MTTRRLISRLTLCALPLMAATSPPLQADPETTLNLYLNGGRYWFDNDRLKGTPFQEFDLELSDTTGGGGGLGYSITDRWALEGVVDYFSVSVKGINEKVDVYNYHMDLLYHFAGNFCGAPCRWQPYAAFGVGEIRTEYDGAFGPERDWHRRQTMVNGGFGVKYQLGPRWQTRVDARAFQGVEEGGLDGFVSISIGYQWSEYPVFWRDLDGDGIIDKLDDCPQTPPGVFIDADGCPVDSDQDGVPDYLDLCPGTPLAVAVDDSGCPD
ncbi:outer membrane beta-barrel protein [Microbulbifer sp. TYP-18]|uniref:outer membrane beta-barrel protein n=1 Tax=Microbulbifer sp. TYP-18 TaxID=3230024 RepID=UPI0034C6883F